MELADGHRLSEPYLMRLTKYDRLIDEPTRLGLLGMLACQDDRWLSYRQLHDDSGLSNTNLSNHLAKLEEVGIVEIKREFVGNRPGVLVGLSRFGAARLEAHLN